MKLGRRMVENWFSSGHINQIDHKKGILSRMNWIEFIEERGVAFEVRLLWRMIMEMS